MKVVSGIQDVDFFGAVGVVLRGSTTVLFIT